MQDIKTAAGESSPAAIGRGIRKLSLDTAAAVAAGQLLNFGNSDHVVVAADGVLQCGCCNCELNSCLGVPGDAVTAIMIGALTIQGLTPGPMLFETNKVLVHSIFIGMFIANTLMCICGFAGIRVFSKVLSVPKVILTPIIFALCIIGSFAMKNSLFDVWVMLIAGVVGYFMSKTKVPTSPAILGLILGPMAEKNFRTALLVLHHPDRRHPVRRPAEGCCRQDLQEEGCQVISFLFCAGEGSPAQFFAFFREAGSRPAGESRSGSINVSDTKTAQHKLRRFCLKLRPDQPI